MYISEETLDRFIHEDIPYLDLTTFLLDIGHQNKNCAIQGERPMVTDHVDLLSNQL